MRIKPKDRKDLLKTSLKEIIEIYGKEGSLKHLTCQNLKDIHYRISLESDLINPPLKQSRFNYLCELERYFKLVSQVRSSEQLSLF
jgi:hypothetical protein